MKKMLAAITGVALFGTSVWAESFSLDASHATLGFAVRHLVVSTVRGSFAEAAGSLETDASGIPAKAAVTIKAASLATGVADRDKHLRSPDFFDVEKYPELKFESTKIEKAADGVTITGNLTIRDVTKEVTIPCTLSGPITDPWGNVRIGLEGNTQVNRKDFGMVWSKVLDGGGLVVEDQVKIDVSLEFIKNK